MLAAGRWLVLAAPEVLEAQGDRPRSGVPGSRIVVLVPLPPKASQRPYSFKSPIRRRCCMFSASAAPYLPHWEILAAGENTCLPPQLSKCRSMFHRLRRSTEHARKGTNLASGYLLPCRLRLTSMTVPTLADPQSLRTWNCPRAFDVAESQLDPEWELRRGSSAFLNLDRVDHYGPGAMTEPGARTSTLELAQPGSRRDQDQGPASTGGRCRWRRNSRPASQKHHARTKPSQIRTRRHATGTPAPDDQFRGSVRGLLGSLPGARGMECQKCQVSTPGRWPVGTAYSTRSYHFLSSSSYLIPPIPSRAYRSTPPTHWCALLGVTEVPRRCHGVLSPTAFVELCTLCEVALECCASCCMLSTLTDCRRPSILATLVIAPPLARCSVATTWTLVPSTISTCAASSPLDTPPCTPPDILYSPPAPPRSTK